MRTVGKGTHYCVHCGFDMKAREERFCEACDGDLCEPRKYAALSTLKVDHPRIILAKLRWNGGSGCRHRPKCLTFQAHVGRSV